MITLYVNIIGSGRNEGFDLPAYVDIGLRGRIEYLKNGRVKRIHLPRKVFQTTHCYKLGKS